MRKYIVFSHQGTLVEFSDGLNRQCAGLDPAGTRERLFNDALSAGRHER